MKKGTKDKNGMNFSVLNRSEIIDELKGQEFDLIVIGGGITGAGILLDAASRGLKTALIEKMDFASGTSSKSTKLIHGGLRYLKQMDFALVQEVGTERAIVHRLAPHLVLPEKMLLPLVENGSYGKLMTSIGLKVYDVLAKVKGDDRRKMLNRKEALALEPLLPKERLKGAGWDAEYRTDDARLTIELIKTSLKYEGMAINYMEAMDFIYDEGHISGIKARDISTGNSIEVKSKVVVSATGPWVDELREKNKSLEGKRLHLTKGVHLVVSHKKLPVKQSIYFDIPDGRMMFAIPRGKITYFGTTDTDYKDSKENVETNAIDVAYLIAAVNQMFPSIELKDDDIISSWAGLRPLIHQDGKSASELSRKDEIFISPTGLISIAGGKLTGYRKMSERIVDRVIKKVANDTKPKFLECTTDKISLCGNEFRDYEEVQKYIDDIFGKIKTHGLKYQNAWYLVTTYGKQTEIIMKQFHAFEHEDPEWRLLRAELHFCTEREMILTPMDFFIRRTGRLYFDIDSIRSYRSEVISEFFNLTNAAGAKMEQWTIELDNELDRHSNFESVEV